MSYSNRSFHRPGLPVHVQVKDTVNEPDSQTARENINFPAPPWHIDRKKVIYRGGGLHEEDIETKKVESRGNEQEPNPPKTYGRRSHAVKPNANRLLGPALPGSCAG
eukprot:61269-Rhodomonas_salina.9